MTRSSERQDVDQTSTQHAYHRGLFPALYDWERTERAIVEFSEDSRPSGLLGLDQMGHFGPHGCDLVAEVVREAFPRRVPALCELGSGFGGALRYTVDRLAAHGVGVGRAYGVDLVPEHCAVSRRISARQGRAAVTEICASATDVPLPDGSLDVVTVTGSMPHFPRPGEVLCEAARLLRPGGLLVLTEEVSLTRSPRGPGAAFRERHPPGVFFTTPVDERLEQLRRAGFIGTTERPLRQWAIALLEERLKVVSIFRGSADGIYGERSVDSIRATLGTARNEFRSGRIVPMLLSARRAADPRRDTAAPTAPTAPTRRQTEGFH
ncbi:methyltransferase [Streptomyces dioscori]|uniref:Methyltransferase n=1 Tax=Streptomyces dioscori TaxID=2109333 RepID=A0A2P8Q3L4_9ACTN|nr:class I SAM-dependent methyltransferase [Streptomyces dioscori]PSM40850.1 methyltransferase [Streptomyces dioscori]